MTMKNVRIIFPNPSKKVTWETYVLPDGLNGETWKKIKEDYWYIIIEKINNATRAGKLDVVIDLDKLPILNDNFSDLKLFMEAELLFIPYYVFSIPEWNVARQGAKSKFTASCIDRLDSSGYITKLMNKAKKLKHGK